MSNRSSILAGAAVVALVAGTALKHASALDPASLWLDDQWVALAASRMSWTQFLTLHVPTPLGFGMMTSILASLFEDREWPVQIVPYLASLALVPVFFAVVVHLTSSKLAALFGAALAATNPLVATYSVRVKQYGSDLLIATLIIWLAQIVVRRWDRRYINALVGLCALAPIFSFPSIFISLALANGIALHTWRQKERDETKRALSLRLAIAVNLATAAVFLVYLAPLASPAMSDYWHGYYLDLSSLASIAQFFSRNYWQYIAQAFPFWTPLLAALAPVGVFLMWREPRHRPLAIGWVILQIGLVVACAAQELPMGTGRVEIFTLSSLWLPVCFVVSKVYVPVRLVAVGIGCYYAATAAPTKYPAVADRQALELVCERITPADGLMLYRQAVWSAAYYGPWSFHFVPEEQYAHNFDVAFHRPMTHLVPPFDEVIDDGAPAPTRWFYLSAHGNAQVDENVDQAMQQMGFQDSWSTQPSKRSRVTLFAPP